MPEISELSEMRTVSPAVFRVHWIPGTDQLLGTCHCGAEHTAEDPVELWTWLHGHPVGHRPRAAVEMPAADPPRVLAKA